MDTLFLILLPLVISSLGFLSYRHPPIARQILKPLLYVSVASFLLLQIFYLIQSSAYYKASDATRINIVRQQEKNLNLDSLYNAVNDRDSVHNIINDNGNQREKFYDIYSGQKEVSDSIEKNIDILLKNSRATNNTYLFYCFAGFLIIVILYGLSFLFDNIHNKEKVNDINSFNDQAE